MEKKTINKMIRISPEEMDIIRSKAKAVDMSASEYMRRMSLDGEILKLEVPEYRETIKEINRIGVLFNQITRRLNETDSFYYDDMQNIKEEHENLCRMLNQFLSTLRLNKV